MAITHNIVQSLSTVNGKEKIELDFNGVSISKNDSFYMFASNGEVVINVPSDISNDIFIDWVVLVYNAQPDTDAIASKEDEKLVLLGNNLNLEIDFGSLE